MINHTLTVAKAAQLTRSFSASMLLVMLLSACNNSLDLRSLQHETGPDNPLQHATMQSMQAAALSVSEAASAARYINPQAISHSAAKDHAAPQQLPSQSSVRQFAGRYTGQIPCSLQAAMCSNGTINMTLTLLPDGSAIRTLAQQGKVHGMLDRDTAAWTVAANDQTIRLTLPNQEIWHFNKLADNQLQFQSGPSALGESASALGQYALVASSL